MRWHRTARLEYRENPENPPHKGRYVASSYPQPNFGTLTPDSTSCHSASFTVIHSYQRIAGFRYNCINTLYQTQEGTPMTPHEDMLNRIQYHIELTSAQSRRYYIIYRSLQWGIPIISAILTISASGKAGASFEAMAVWIGIIITILTSINSALLPGERFVSSSLYANKFSTFRTSLNLEIKKIEDNIDDDKEKKEP